MSQLTLMESLPADVKVKILNKVKTEEWQDTYIESKLDDVDFKVLHSLARAYYEKVLIPELLAEDDSIIIESYMWHHHHLEGLDDATEDLDEIKELLDINLEAA